LNLPGRAAISAVEDSSLFAGDKYVVTSIDRHREEVGGQTTLQIFPGCAAVIGAQNNSARTHSIASSSVGKGNRIKPFLQIFINAFPRFAGIFSAQDCSIRTDGNSMLQIRKADVLEPAEGACVLKVPRGAAVFRVQDHPARSHCPSVFGRNEVDAKKIFPAFDGDWFPGNAPIRCSKYGSTIANRDSVFLIYKLD
jgi:hypothetical protein